MVSVANTMALAAASDLSGAARLAEQDPHGWILTVTAIAVVFGVLLLLWLIFALLGMLFTRKKKADPAGDDNAAGPSGLPDRHSRACPGNLSPSLAAAIAVAIERYRAESTGETEDGALHDTESYRITIHPDDTPGPWGAPGRNFRKTPK